MVKRKGNSKNIREKIANKQGNKCANDRNSDIPHMNDQCKLWKFGDGKFDEAGYEIDHIIEHSVGGSDKEKNMKMGGLWTRF